MVSDAVYDKIKEDHYRLHSKLQEMLKIHTLDHLRRPEHSGELLKEVNTLLAKIKKEAGNAKTREEYVWLVEATKNWQLICLGVLDAPLYVEVLGAPATFDDAYAGQWDKKAIEEWVRKKSFFVARDRVELMKSKLIMDILSRGVEQVSSSRKEADRDWVLSEVLFACDMLKGTLDFCRCATSDLFDTLGRVWLHDVMDVHAYFIWKEKKGEVLQVDEEARRADFFEACAMFRDRLANEKLKCSSDETAQKCKEYVIKRYLKEGEATKGNYALDKAKAGEEIKRRAQRSFALAGDPDEGKNYFHAEEYVRSFYESAIPAVLGTGSESVKAKQSIYLAFEKSDGPTYYSSIADCFEASVLMYCVNDLPHLPRKD